MYLYLYNLGKYSTTNSTDLNNKDNSRYILKQWLLIININSYILNIIKLKLYITRY